MGCGRRARGRDDTRKSETNDNRKSTENGYRTGMGKYNLPFQEIKSAHRGNGSWPVRELGLDYAMWAERSDPLARAGETGSASRFSCSGRFDYALSCISCGSRCCCQGHDDPRPGDVVAAELGKTWYRRRSLTWFCPASHAS